MVVQFKIDKDIAKMMTADEINKNLWEEVKAAAKEGYQVGFLSVLRLIDY